MSEFSRGKMAPVRGAVDGNDIDHCDENGNRNSSKSPPSEQTFNGRKILGRVLMSTTIISFLLVGLIINVLQVILLLTFNLSSNRKWRVWHKKLNGYLIYVLFSPTFFLLYYWSRAELTIYLDDVQLIEDSKKQLLGIIIPNHSYEVDYMVCFVLADQLGNIGGYKSFSKYELKYLPIVGWALWMSDIIFVKRDWQKDRKSLKHKLNKLFDHEQCLVGIFAEGTRWTPEKHEASVEFARSRGLKPLEHHLMPRSRGFNYTMRHYWRELILNKRMDEKLFRLFNMQIVMNDKMNFKDFLDGKQLKADIYCEEVPLDKEIREEVLKSRDEDDCPKLTQLLRDIYRRKDELVNEYRANNNRFKFRNSKTGGFFPYQRTKMSLFIWFAGILFTYSTLIYLVTQTALANSVAFWSTLVGFITGCHLMLKRIERESQANNQVLAKGPQKSVEATSGMDVNVDDSAGELADESEDSDRSPVAAPNAILFPKQQVSSPAY